MDDENLPAPDLIDFTYDDFADQFLIPLEDILLFYVPNTLTKRLARRHYSPTPKIFEVNLFGHFIAYHEFRVGANCVGIFNLCNRIVQIPILYHFPDMQNLHIAMIWIQDDLE